MNHASDASSEMEFLDISLTKDSGLFAPCYSQYFLLADFKENQKTILFSVLHTKYIKKISNTRKLKSIYE
jgi:hypothetical protein